MTPMLCLVGRDSLHITDASTVRCDTLQPRDKAAWHARCADCLSGMCARARVKLKIETGMHRVCKEQRGAPDQLSQAWAEKIFWRNQEVPWVGDESVPFAFFVLSLIFLPGKFEYGGGNKRNFWKFYWFDPPGIDRVSNVKTPRPALSNVIKYFCYPLFHSQFSSLLKVLYF